jgi:DNA polymerase-3 subunit alpha
MVDDYIKRKHGIDKVKYPHPMLKSILKETYGIILYQEQVMKIANVMAGFSLGQADILRRAMGKKKVEVMDQQKEMFVKGSVGNGISKEKAEEVFELIAYFAGYGFNKSHSTAYATISMMTAYLKTHYTAKYMCSVINNCSSREEQEKILMESKKINNIHIHPPKIWWSKNITRSIYSDVYLGFNTIKGIGENLNIPPDFNDMEEDEILSYLGDKEITKNLIKSGCFGIEKNYTDLIKRSKTNGSSVNLFDFIEEGKEEEKDLFTKEKKLSFQKEFLGCFFDGHPLDKFDENNIDNTGEQEGEEKDAIVYINKINKRSNKIHFIVEDINKSEEMIMYQKSTKYKEGDIVHILYIFKDGRFIIQKMNAMKRINIENTIKSLL